MSFPRQEKPFKSTTLTNKKCRTVATAAQKGLNHLSYYISTNKNMNNNNTRRFPFFLFVEFFGHDQLSLLFPIANRLLCF